MSRQDDGFWQVKHASRVLPGCGDVIITFVTDRERLEEQGEKNVGQ